MADLPSSFSKVNDEEMRQDTINSEGQYAKLGSNDNFLKDGLESNIASRISGDSNIQTQINDIETAMNGLVNIPRLVVTRTLGPFVSPSPTPFAWGVGTPIPLTRSKVVPSFFAYKFGSPSPNSNSYMFLSIFYDQFDSVIYEETAVVVPALSRNQWDFADFVIINGYQVEARFYKNITVSI